MAEINKLMEEAKELFDEEKYKEAIKKYNEIIEDDTENEKVYNKRGTAYFYIDKYEKAVEDFTQVLELDPKIEEVFNNRGLAYLNLDKYEKAVEDFTQALELDPKIEEAFNSRGFAYLNLDKYEKAVEDFTQALELDPKNEEAFHNRGLAYLYIDKYEKAVEDFTQTLELDPKNEEAFHNRGLAYLYLDKYKKAVEDFTQALKLDPKNEKAFHDRGLAYLYLDKYEKAVEDCTQGLELDSKNEKAFHDRGLAYLNLDKYEKAVEDFTQTLELDPKNEEAFNNRGLAYLYLDKYEKAVEDFTQAIEIGPDDENTFIGRGFVYTKINKYNNAIGDYYKAIKTNPQSEFPYNELNRMYNKKEQIRELIRQKWKKLVNNISLKNKYYYKIANLLFRFNSQKETDRLADKYILEGIDKDITGLPLAANLFKNIQEEYKDNLYHYTSLESLKSILEDDKEMHVSKVEFMNDPAERNYALEVVQNIESIEDIGLNETKITDEEQFLKEVKIHTKDIFNENFDKCKYIEEFINRLEEVDNIDENPSQQMGKYFQTHFDNAHINEKNNSLECINTFINHFVNNRNSSKKSQLKQISKYYFDVPLPEIGQNWWEIYVLSLATKDDCLPLWNNYSDRDGYNLGVKENKLLKHMENLEQKEGHFDTHYYSKVIYDEDKFCKGIKELCSDWSKYVEDNSALETNSDSNIDKDSLSIAELKYIILTQIVLNSIFIKKKEFEPENEYRIAFLVLNEETRKAQKKLRSNESKDIEINKENSFSEESLLEQEFSREEEIDVNFRINQNNSLVPYITIPLAEDDESLDLLEEIKIGPANRSDLAKKGLQRFLDEHDIEDVDIEKSDISLRY